MGTFGVGAGRRRSGERCRSAHRRASHASTAVRCTAFRSASRTSSSDRAGDRGRVAAAQGHIAAEDARSFPLCEQPAPSSLQTVTVEFACFDPVPTRNPWDRNLKRSPGGSSSGSAAAWRWECVWGPGNADGRIARAPASYCGVATCKPTFGRVDRTGVVPVSYHFDHVGTDGSPGGDLRLLLACLPSLAISLRPNANVSKPLDLAPVWGLSKLFHDGPMRTCGGSRISGRELAGNDVTSATPTVDFEAIQTVHTTSWRGTAAYTARISPLIGVVRSNDHGPTRPGLPLRVSSTQFLGYLHEYRRLARRCSGMWTR